MSSVLSKPKKSVVRMPCAVAGERTICGGRVLSFGRNCAFAPKSDSAVPNRPVGHKSGKTVAVRVGPHDATEERAACIMPGIHDQHIFTDLLGADGLVGHEQRGVGGGCGYPDAREHSRRQHAVRVREHGARAYSARRAFNDVVDEIHIASMGEFCLINQLE